MREKETLTKATRRKEDYRATPGIASGTKVTNSDDSKSKSQESEQDSFELQQPQVVPLQQFLNAMALIQDLENELQC